MHVAVAAACGDSSSLSPSDSVICQPQSADLFPESFVPVSLDCFPLSFLCREFQATLASGCGFPATCAATSTIQNCALTVDVRRLVATDVLSNVPTYALLSRDGAADRHEIGGTAVEVVVELEEVPFAEGLPKPSVPGLPCVLLRVCQLC